MSESPALRPSDAERPGTPPNENHQSEALESLFFAACREGNAVQIELLVANDGADVNTLTDGDSDDGASPLHAAANGGVCKAIEVLVRLGASVAAVDANGLSPLHYAASKGHCDAIRSLVALGSAVDAADGRGLGPLHHACFHDQTEAARVLVVEFGANIEAKNVDGFTPLHAAALSTAVSAQSACLRWSMVPMWVL